MKWRIVKVTLTNDVYYRVKIKKWYWFRWKDLTPHEFKSENSAMHYLKSVYEKKYEIVSRGKF
jgi:expansin (peptidoglycan-binding protein)